MSTNSISLARPEIDSLKIFTLNCWGLRYFSDHRQSRMKEIAQHLSEHDYDVVFLQEVWIQSDFEFIRSKTKSIYRFAHMFNNASILGTSGLVILAKWIPRMIHFHPYTINGTPFRPFHGDWFSTKGVAYVRIKLLGLNLHLFSTHMHAQYNPEESLTDQYSVHRICQAYELAKFVNLMACSCSETSSRDLIILAGDMNTSSKELPYRLVVELTALNDCYKLGSPKKASFKHSPPDKFKFAKFECSDESSDEELITCGHKDNTFTAAPPPNSTMKTGKRIDFILYKVRDSNLHNIGKLYDFITMINSEESYSKFLKMENSFLTCSSESIRISAKDVSGLSFSDHQPVVAKLNLNMQTKTYEEIIRCNADMIRSDFTQDEQVDKANNYLEEANDCRNDNVPNSLGSAVRINLQKLGSKLRQKLSAYQISNSHHLPYQRLNSSPLLGKIEELLAIYLEQNRPTRNYIRIMVVFLVLITLTLVSIKYFVEASNIETGLVLAILLIVLLIILFLCLLTFRTERNAIYAILNDIRKKNSFSRDGLLENE